jgi:hypothetical protein
VLLVVGGADEVADEPTAVLGDRSRGAILSPRGHDLGPRRRRVFEPPREQRLGGPVPAVARGEELGGRLEVLVGEGLEAEAGHRASIRLQREEDCGSTRRG